ncbi:DUF3168 domain-containing protein [Cetobacterium sp.]|uniref:DUF3168 domain-containing protein n=1 Tax=Cetobacterium sp. TaxID=2071632 RepID=UPI003F3BCE64
MTESEVYLLLKNTATIKALVNERVYPLVSPQNVTKPYITYRVIAGLKLQCLGGQIYQGDYRMQIDCFSLTYSNVKAISEAVKNALVGFMDSMNISIIDDYDDESQLFKQIIDFKIKD